MEDWFPKYRQVYLDGTHHGFILTGDVHGKTPGGFSTLECLEDSLYKEDPGRDLLVVYNVQSRFRFPLAGARAKANKLLGEMPAPSSNSLLGVVQAQAGQKSGDWFDRSENIMEDMMLIERLMCVDTTKRKPRERHEESAFARVVVYIEQAELICTDKDLLYMDATEKAVFALLFRWGRDPRMGATNNTFFLSCSRIEDLHRGLRDPDAGLYLLDIPLPSIEEREAYIKRYLESRDDAGKPIPLTEITTKQLASMAGGLNLVQIENVLLKGARRSEGVTAKLVREEKAQIIKLRFGELAEFMDPFPGGLAALGGMKDTADFLMNKVVKKVRERNKRAPKGVLLVGPPGTGKTLAARATAEDAGLTAINLNMSAIKDQFVGQSEKKFAALLRFLKEMSPTMLFIDEIEQLFRRAEGGESSVTGSLFQMLLIFMSSDLEGKVLIIAATNRPDLIDPALLRPGRFSVIRGFLLPTKEARVGVFLAQAGFQSVLLSKEIAVFAAGKTEKYSQADISLVVFKAIELMEDRGEEKEVSQEDMELALKYIRVRSPETAGVFTLAALTVITDLQDLPQEYLDLLEREATVSQQLAVEEQKVFPRSYGGDRAERAF